MAQRPFENFYDHAFAVLSGDAAVTAIVTDPDNIRPANDPVEPKAGPLLRYGWESAEWDRKALRGSGVLILTASHQDNRIKAMELLEAAREALTEKALTAAAPAKVRVHLFREREALTDGGIGTSGRYESASEFDVKLTEV